MASNPSTTKKTLNLRRGCERSRLAAEALAAAYELLTPILRRSLPYTSGSPQRRSSVEQHQRLAGGQ
jgi:hypothetical protein